MLKCELIFSDWAWKMFGEENRKPEGFAAGEEVAVRVGFEPTEPVKVQRFSRPPDSTALAPHRALCGVDHLPRPFTNIAALVPSCPRVESRARGRGLPVHQGLEAAA